MRYQYLTKHSRDSQNKKLKHTTSLSKNIPCTISRSSKFFTFYLLGSMNNLRLPQVSFFTKQPHLMSICLKKPGEIIEDFLIFKMKFKN